MTYRIGFYQISQLDVAHLQPRYRIRNEYCDIEVTQSVQFLLQHLESFQGQDLDVILENYQKDRCIDQQELKKVVEFFQKKGLIFDQDSTKSFVSADKPMSLLWFRLRLWNVDQAEALWRRLTFLISPQALSVMGFAFLLVNVAFWGLFFFDTQRFDGEMTGPSFLIFFVLIVLSGFLHECFHVLAMKKYRLPAPQGIGIGIYWYMPVLYADTHASWELPRKQKALVDSCGVFGQFFMLIVLFPFLWFFPSVMLRDFFLFTNFTLLSMMNPFLKMDGYWFLSDLLGISNLSRKITLSLKYYFTKKGTFPFRDIPRRTKSIVAIYTVLSVIFLSIFMGFFFFYAISLLRHFDQVFISKITSLKHSDENAIFHIFYEWIRDFLIVVSFLFLMISGFLRIFLKKGKKA